MIFGGYRAGQESLPRVMHISIARYVRDLPRPGEARAFLVAIHEEGTAITWQQNVTIDAETETALTAGVGDLHLWSVQRGLTSARAAERVSDVGNRLYASFIGTEGAAYLEQCLGDSAPTAILFDVDETILDLPWELLRDGHGPLATRVPFGRLVRTRVTPRPGRDPLTEDTTVKILAVANPTEDLPTSESEVASLAALEGQHGAYSVSVTLLQREQATRAKFQELAITGEYDILHFAGHAMANAENPEEDALIFADGKLSADDVLGLSWAAPPYLAFNSACQSGHAVAGRPLVSAENHGNGLAAAFLAIGSYGYAGYFWPVTDEGAGLFAETFYERLFGEENVGLAFLDARSRAIAELGDDGDLTGYSAIIFGDVGSKQRRDFATAV